ncbi:hypothetical protein ACFL6D_00065 [Spirochaetota bacterium]
MRKIGIDSFFLTEVLKKAVYYGLIRYNYNLLKYFVFSPEKKYSFFIYHPYEIPGDIKEKLTSLFFTEDAGKKKSPRIMTI